jgi:hypothetical protein
MCRTVSNRFDWSLQDQQQIAIHKSMMCCTTWIHPFYTASLSLSKKHVRHIDSNLFLFVYFYYYYIRSQPSPTHTQKGKQSTRERTTVEREKYGQIAAVKPAREIR